MQSWRVVAASRHLAAIMFTDLAGSTAFAQTDERGALARLKEQANLLRPTFEEYEGREVKSTGDGFLVEFESSLQATRCAIEIQRRLQRRNRTTSSPPILVRIGIHIGDVERRGTDIFGDAVNLAARVEPFAEPGGVCLSEQVFAQVKNKLAEGFESLGPTTLKGVLEPMVLYRVSLGGDGSEAGERSSEPRLAVLPLTNISPDHSDEYFSDGMTEELISTLAKLPGLIVISRTSVMPYKNQSKRVPDIARELKVNTVLEGSVRKAGTRIRITVQLIEAATDRHLWAETYDRNLDDVFAVQAEIAQRVATSLSIRLHAEDERKLQRVSTLDSEAHLLYLRGLFDFNQGTQEGIRAAISIWEDATRRDSTYATAYAALAEGHATLGFFGWAAAAEASAEARRYAEKALALDDSLVQAHIALAGVLAISWEFEASARERIRAVELSPGDSSARSSLALSLISQRRFKEAWEQVELALSLAPNDLRILELCATWYLYSGKPERAAPLYEQITARNPTKVFSEHNLGLAHLRMGQVKRGLAEIEAAIRRATTFDLATQSDLAYALALDGQVDRARQVISEMERYHDEHRTGASWIASAWGGLGDREKTLQWLERAYEERDPTMLVLMGTGFTLDFLRPDPRFEALARRMGHPMIRSDQRPEPVQGFGGDRPGRPSRTE